jgi:hypothetical protein
MPAARISFIVLAFLSGITSSFSAFAADGIRHDRAAKTIELTSQQGQLKVIIDYNTGCRISSLFVNGRNTLAPAGVYTGISTVNEGYSSQKINAPPRIGVTQNILRLDDINYGTGLAAVKETWLFIVTKIGITWTINRTYENAGIVDGITFPAWHFKSMSAWKGGILDNGGMVWCKYLKQSGDTYGVHTGGIRFWNETSGDGLSINGKASDMMQIASQFSRNQNGEFLVRHIVSDSVLQQRYNLNRFVHKQEDVFAPFHTGKSASASFELHVYDYNKTFDRGTLPTINERAVRELMNTTARYGVVDNNIVGGNGWLTNWKCLHEPFFAQIALGLADPNYTRNLEATLNQERDMAVMEDGRVLSRWHNEPGDEMPGTYNAKTGYYETVWGYTVDAQTGYVINTAELFDLTGNIDWLRSHKKKCEDALQWLIGRDADNDGLFEMVNKNIREEKCSDWIDIVWASHENAFINAQMYAALIKWADCETLLGDNDESERYRQLAQKLKEAFNKPVDKGGFWLAEKKQYVYWRDDDNTIHGDNLVTPVNFAAIAFGVCDDTVRIRTIIGEIERRTMAEKLFHWPLCFDSFRREEVSERNWPFPTYENGDIFPTWGYLGVRAYVQYDKALAVKYIRQLLQQYEKDGLSSQRYERRTQKGVGDDILSGICTGVTALYSDIYGIQPKWNRLVIAPSLTPSLNGTKFNYTLRDTVYKIGLSANRYEVSAAHFIARSNQDFAVSATKGQLHLYPGRQDTICFSIGVKTNRAIRCNFQQTEKDVYTFSFDFTDKYDFVMRGLVPGTNYSVVYGGKKQVLPTGPEGRLIFQQTVKASSPIRISKQ